MMRTQPPGFRWLVGGFALIAAVAFGLRFSSSGDRAELILGVLCLVTAGYWLIFDREPAPEDPPLTAVDDLGDLDDVGDLGSDRHR